ncbi:hypothetical protein BDV26DRAFT_275701 [Aspergillus bertholletiae]|uniref:Uncharacterized protein n=1 Tax=Aspergillus bertholletiae TaxID=1226010 RepID=A0A5N7AP48_9EURO|nr:hypothetical protein BDV26DRAFT_275701 [Aspergillus bertholletiae]
MLYISSGDSASLPSFWPGNPSVAMTTGSCCTLEEIRFLQTFPVKGEDACSGMRYIYTYTHYIYRSIEVRRIIVGLFLSFCSPSFPFFFFLFFLFLFSFWVLYF